MRKVLFTLISFTLLIGLLSWNVDADATITTIDAPWAEWYSWLKFDDGKWHIIMLLDRNVWAITNDITSTWSYWYHFQRWNNHWFESCYTNGCAWFPWGETTTTQQADVSSYLDSPSTYSSWLFVIKKVNWTKNNSDINLRWWSGDNNSNYRWYYNITEDNIKDRQWPCPAWYHVPGEWEYIYLEFYRSKVYTWEDSYKLSKFYSDFKIPFAGRRNTSNNQIANQGIYTYLWTSSPVSASAWQSIRPFWNSESLYINNMDYRANGLSVRCFYDSYLFPKYKILFYDWGSEITSWVVKRSNSRSWDIPNITKDGYEFEGWFENWASEPFDFEEPIYRDIINWTIILYAQWTPKEYTITFTDESQENEDIVYSWEYQSIVDIQYPNWTREGYIISWSDKIPKTMPLNWMTITANWTKESKYSGWWGGRSNKQDNNSLHNSAEEQEWSQENSYIEPQNNDQEVKNTSSNTTEQQTYSEEFQQAYKFAYENWITSRPTIQEAEMDWKITRIAMAKMLSQYAINVLWIKPDETRVNKFNDVSDDLNADYNNSVTLAYQLWIMWINMPKNRFRPYDEVTRAEFWTALSRMLYKIADWINEYYSPHLLKLKQEKIITNDDHNIKELRWYIMIMLMRSVWWLNND